MKAHKKEFLSSATKPFKTESQRKIPLYTDISVLAFTVLYSFRQDNGHFPLSLTSVIDRISFSDVLLYYKCVLI